MSTGHIPFYKEKLLCFLWGLSPCEIHQNLKPVINCIMSVYLSDSSSLEDTFVLQLGSFPFLLDV
uniref:Myb family transcription factor APL isoform X2 n=1 Tax=Rhizophora mucronata TaxID=61149 RepID=A0A2P2PTM4_RHIMU